MKKESLLIFFFLMMAAALHARLNVELDYFEARIHTEKKVNISWGSTAFASEGFFKLLHSHDGLNWQSVDSVPLPDVYAGLKHYSISHLNPAEGINYYKLLYFTNDGKVALGNTIFIDLPKTAVNVQPYPNPASDFLYISSQDDSVPDCFLFNSRGEKEKEIIPEQTGDKTYRMDLQHLSPGIYFLRSAQHNYRIVVR
jgi:hypothetical protein